MKRLKTRMDVPLLLLHLLKSFFFLILPFPTALIIIILFFRPHKDILVTRLFNKALIENRTSVLVLAFAPDKSMSSNIK